MFRVLDCKDFKTIKSTELKSTRSWGLRVKVYRVWGTIISLNLYRLYTPYKPYRTMKILQTLYILQIVVITRPCKLFRGQEFLSSWRGGDYLILMSQEKKN